MTHTYNINGMTCGSCVAKVKSELLKIADIAAADVQLAAPQATISMQHHVPLETLQSALRKAGNYSIQEADGGMQHTSAGETGGTWFSTYKPILLLFFYISIISIIAASTHGGFNGMMAMTVFMSGFFLSFSFFKLLDLEGFADNYSTYDIIAKRYRAWGYIYPFIELLLGIAYALHFYPLFTNTVTVLVMAVSLTGVLQSLLNKRKIRCACLGAVFNLPMSTVTVIEDVSMIVMGAIMLFNLL